jgi:hypothetical protein
MSISIQKLVLKSCVLQNSNACFALVLVESIFIAGFLSSTFVSIGLLYPIKEVNTNMKMY